jgi:hypothetical protein
MTVSTREIKQKQQEIFHALEKSSDNFISLCCSYDHGDRLKPRKSKMMADINILQGLSFSISNQWPSPSKDAIIRSRRSESKGIDASSAPQIGRSMIWEARDRRQGCHGWNLIHSCVDCDAYDALFYLLTIGHPIDMVDSSTSRMTPLMLSANRPQYNLAIIDLLMLNGADPFLVDINGDSVLHYAARNGNIDAIDIIIDVIVNESLSQRSKASLWEDVVQLVNIRNCKGSLAEDVGKSKTCQQRLHEIRIGKVQTSPSIRFHMHS